MKKSILVLAAVAVLSMSSSLTVLAGWTQDSRGYQYKREDGSYVRNDWLELNQIWYHFDASGYCETGWIWADGYWWYQNADGSYACNGSQVIDGTLYSFDENGHLKETKSATDITSPLMLYDQEPVAQNSSYSNPDGQTNKEHEKWIKVLGFFPSYYDGTSNREYYAGKKYNSLKASVAPKKKDEWYEDEYLYLEIYGDDKLLYRSEGINYKTSIFDIAVDISNCDMVNIVCIGEHSQPNPESIILKDARFENSGTAQTQNVSSNQGVQIQSGQNESATNITTPLVLYDQTPVAQNSSYSDTDSQTNKENEKWIKVLTFFPSYYDGTSNMEYYAGKKYNSLRASVAPEKKNAWDEDDYLYLEIYGDDKLLYRSGEITYKTSIFDIAVDISNCDMVNIVCVGEHSKTNPESIILKDARFE